MSKEKEIKCEDCLHHFACEVNSEYVPSPCRAFEDKQGYRKQSEGEWIRAENPPEEYRDECGELIPFLVCCQGTVYPFRAMYDGANWGDGIGVLKVTHWMPLPEPPKGG